MNNVGREGRNKTIARKTKAKRRCQRQMPTGQRLEGLVADTQCDPHEQSVQATGCPQERSRSCPRAPARGLRSRSPTTGTKCRHDVARRLGSCEQERVVSAQEQSIQWRCKDEPRFTSGGPPQQRAVLYSLCQDAGLHRCDHQMLANR